MKKKYNVHIIESRCKMCGLCVGFCPQKVLEAKINTIPEVLNPDKCIGCKLCYQKCPDIAIFVEERTAPYNE